MQSVQSGPQIALFVPAFDRGGVERMLTQLARGLDGLGIRVDMVVNRRSPHYLNTLPDSVRVVELSVLAGKPLDGAVAYLRAERPVVLLSSKDENNLLALEAKRIAGVSTQVWLRSAVTESSRVAGQLFWIRWMSYRNMRRIYPAAEGVIAVSHDLARDVAEITGMPLADIRVAHNPVVTPEMLDQAAQPVSHPWLNDTGTPVIIGIGRLARVKNFALLIEAFARVHKVRACRLLILGEGRERARLEHLAAKLGVRKEVDLPGYVDNPYSYLSRARLFVSSSLSEGSPNALTEALALGVPVVATDCLSGPRELLQDGRYGPLVPVKDADALAHAMLSTLENPLPADFLREAALPYTIEGSAREYASILGLLPAEEPYR